MQLMRSLARVADWKFVITALLLAAAASAAAWLSPAVAPGAGGRIEIDREWLRAQAFRRNREIEAEAAREGRPLQRGSQ